MGRVQLVLSTARIYIYFNYLAKDMPATTSEKAVVAVNICAPMTPIRPDQAACVAAGETAQEPCCLAHNQRGQGEATAAAERPEPKRCGFLVSQTCPTLLCYKHSLGADRLVTALRGDQLGRADRGNPQSQGL